MAQLELRLSSKIQKESGRSEIMFRFFNGKAFDLYSGSEIYISPDYFEYFINRSKTEKNGVKVPGHATTSTKKEAEQKGYVLRQSGNIVIRKRIESPEVTYHKAQVERLESLKDYVINQFQDADKTNLPTKWLRDVIDRYNHPEKYIPKEEVKSFYDLAEIYIKKRQLAESHARVYRVLTRAVARYEGFVRATDKDRKDYVWNIDKVTKEDIEDFSDYLRNEQELSVQYPRLFQTLMASYPNSVKPGHDKVQQRGENTVVKMRTRLKSLFLFFVEIGATTNRPFDGVKIGTAKVGTPIYITIGERNQIADADLRKKWSTLSKDDKKAAKMPLATLEQQRDIFVFHCLIGCRVGDLVKLTSKNITDGVLVYTPHKTKDEGEDATQARVPLHEKAIELINKYKGVDAKGRLFPFITPQRYNDAIKMIFALSGITRHVEIRNPLTGETELVPINAIASSHLARRTFIGNLYFKVQDPNLIGKMSGHVEGSEAFKRYRKIEDSTLKDVIDLMG